MHSLLTLIHTFFFFEKNIFFFLRERQKNFIDNKLVYNLSPLDPINTGGIKQDNGLQTASLYRKGPNG